jgi:hypothetical protein
MIRVGNFNKICYISVASVAKLKNFVVFAYTCVRKSSAVNGDFCMNLYSVYSHEAMK